MTDLELVAERAQVASAAWASATAHERAQWLGALAEGLSSAEAELVPIAHRETHLPEARLVGELARTAGQLAKFAEVVREGSYLEATIDHPDANDVPPRPDLRRMLVPVGPVAVWAASNFPFAFSVLGGDTASALAAGNAVVLKAHEGHPELSRETARVASEAFVGAGAPDYSLQLVEGREAGVKLIQHPAIRAAAFTGSTSGGRALFDLAAARPDPIPFYGELGSLNPVVITGSAITERADELARGLVASFTLGGGQFCTKPGIVLIPAGTDFAERVGALLTDAPPVELLNQRIDDGYRALVSDAAEYTTVLAGRQPLDGEQVRPMVFAVGARRVLAEPQRHLEERFGPATLLIEYTDDDELCAVLAAMPGNLTATLHSQERDDVAIIVDHLRGIAGRVLFDGWPTGVAVSWAQHHGGPYPATTSLFTSVGATAIRRFLRPVAYQDAPQRLLPLELRDDNPLGIPRRVDGMLVP